MNMRIHLVLGKFEFWACTRHYSINADAMLAANLAIRCGRRVWSWQKGYSNFND